MFAPLLRNSIRELLRLTSSRIGVRTAIWKTGIPKRVLPIPGRPLLYTCAEPAEGTTRSQRRAARSPVL
jgi:hypothetical protein